MDMAMDTEIAIMDAIDRIEEAPPKKRYSVLEHIYPPARMFPEVSIVR